MKTLGPMLRAIGDGRVPGWAYVCVASATLLLWRQAFATFEAANPARPPAPPDLSADPSLGSRPRLPGIALGNSGTSTYVLVLQPCACNAEFVAPLLAELDASAKLVVAVATEYDKLTQFRKFIGDRAVVLADPGFKVGKALNTVFLPRAYRLDTAGRLAWKQDEPADSLLSPYRIAAARSAPNPGGKP